MDCKWFVGGKLNASYNCLDRHTNSWRKNKVALIWQGEPYEDVKIYTYQMLYREVCKFANVLKDIGVRKGDRVAIYLPMIPEFPISMLACSRIGAIHSVVFGGFSAEALRDRIEDCGAKVLITADGYHRIGKLTKSKDNADKAASESKSIEKIIVVKRANIKDLVMVNGRDLFWDDLTKDADLHIDAEPMDSEDPLFILYTSGSTGKPKGVVHTTAGYLLFVSQTLKWTFDVHDEDIFWCTADIGWVTGHSYVVYGPLVLGATSLMFEGVPTYPKPDRFWEIIENLV